MYLNERRPVAGPQSIVSFVPSQTELLFHLGLEEEVSGITKFCIHPPHWHKEKEKVGGTKTLNIEKVKSIHPTLVIANKEENIKGQIEQLHEFPIWLTDVNNLNEACNMILDIGNITGTGVKAKSLVEEIEDGFFSVRQVSTPINVAYLIWKDPYMTVGHDTFIHDMITRTGMRNVFDGKLRYPVITIDEIKNSGCEVLLLSSEPFPFKEKHAIELTKLLPHIQIKIIDGEMFSWYGSRLLQSVAYFKKLQQELASF